MTSPAPVPSAWLRAYAQVQVVTDSQVIRMLADAADAIRVDMLRIASGTIQSQQMALVRKALLQNQARLLRQLGRVVEARRLDAAARAIHLGTAMDAFVLDRIGSSELLFELTYGLAQTTEVALARMGLSYTALAQEIYNTDVWLGSRVDERITQLLAQGKTAREFAAEAVDWFNPNTPGGVRYAAMRLARSEINNAFHAVSVQQAQDKPWVHGMKWYLSGSHPKPDACNEYAEEDKFDLGAGVWPKADVPRKPHPHCLCYVTPEQASEEAFLDALVSGQYNEWIAKERALASGPRPVIPWR